MQKWQKIGRFRPNIAENFFFKKRRTTFVDHPKIHLWSKFQLKTLRDVLKLWSNVQKN